jgi:choline dehydrogenase-like flavoprotein
MTAGTGQARVDVLIVGAGASGAVAGLRLAQAGISVLCLEQGDWPDMGRARAGSADFELTLSSEWAWDPNERRAPADYPVVDEASDIGVLNWNGVGGGTVLYAAQWQRNLPSDFRVRSLDGVADDWPLGYEELAPYYDRVERDFGVSGLGGDPGYPAGTPPPLPPAPLSPGGRRVAAAHNDLGWHWWPGSNAIATRRYGEQEACQRRAACMWGCPHRAKGSVDVTHWPRALRHGARLVTGARVLRIETDRTGRATGALWRDRRGVVRSASADAVVLAANGVGTPRLLQLSSSPEHPDGLANSSGLVGTRLMLHPFAAAIGLFEDDLRAWQGVWGQDITSLQFYETDDDRDFVRGAKWGLVPTGGPLWAVRSQQWGDAADWGAGFADLLRTRFSRSAQWSIIGEDLPEQRNTVTLSDSVVDGDGLPAPVVTYRTSENSRRMLAFNLERARESLLAAGAYRVVDMPQVRGSGWHLLGTAVMGDDPSSSVVDRWGQSHDVPNLWIFDGSTWPTSSGMNPTATIAAFALRGAERMLALQGGRGHGPR